MGVESVHFLLSLSFKGISKYPCSHQSILTQRQLDNYKSRLIPNRLDMLKVACVHVCVAPPCILSLKSYLQTIV